MEQTSRAEVVIVSIHQYRIAIPIADVHYIIRAVKTFPVTDVPSTVLGLINYHGKPVPLLDIRQKLRLPVKPIDPSDFFILLHFPAGLRAIIADEIIGYEHLDLDNSIPRKTLTSETGVVIDFIQQDKNMLMMADLTALLTTAEDFALQSLISHIIPGELD